MSSEDSVIAFLLLQLTVVDTPRSVEAPVRALVQSRDLLRARRFTELKTALEGAERTGTEDELEWMTYAFRSDDADIPGLLDGWVREEKTSWAPLLARAINLGHRAGKARGAGWASQTSGEQFRRMSELYAAMRTDCAVALSRKPDLCACHAAIVRADKNDESDPRVIDAALKACPKSYSVHVERVVGLRPRWGGSYEEMRGAIELARKLGLDEDEVLNLEGFIAADYASLLSDEGKPQEALKVIDAAIQKTPARALMYERAMLQRRLGNATETLAAVNEAIQRANGGWEFSSRSVVELLAARVWALHELQQDEAARKDIALWVALVPFFNARDVEKAHGIPEAPIAPATTELKR